VPFERKRKPGLSKDLEKATKEVSKSKRKALHIIITRDLHRKLKIYAIDRGITMGELIEEIVSNHLAYVNTKF
jgi:hypothetical protein